MNTTNLADTDMRVAVVTGGSGGIGSVVSKRLAADGMAVAVAGAATPHRGGKGSRLGGRVRWDRRCRVAATSPMRTK